jgi:hypothetical protein
MGYPLQSSALQEALTAAGATVETDLTFSTIRIFLDAHFLPPNPNVPYERLSIRVGAVPASEARAARQFMLEQTIPDLLTWIRELLALPARSPLRRQQHYFRQDWDGP